MKSYYILSGLQREKKSRCRMGKRRWLTIAKASCASSHSSSWWSCDIVIIAHSLKWRSWGSWALNREFKVTSVPVEGFVVVQLLSCVWLSVAPWTAAHQASPSFTIFQAVTVWVCSDSWPLSQWCHPAISSSAFLFSFCLQSFPASGSFSNELTLHIRWSKNWSFNFSISLSNEDSG